MYEYNGTFGQKSWMVHIKLSSRYSLLYKVSYNFHSLFVCIIYYVWHILLGTRTSFCTCCREGHIHKRQSKNNTRLVRKARISRINGWVDIVTIGT